MKKLVLFLSLLFAFTISCSEEQPGNNDTKSPVPLDLKAGSEAVLESINTFGFDIFRLLLDDEPAEKNVFISPTSISLALAMTLNGANNATEDSMAAALRMDHLNAMQINETYRDLINGLVACDEKVLLEIANSIWYRQGFSVEQDFLEINSLYYTAEVAGLDFNSPEALATINNWVAGKTHDKIPSILEYIDPAAVMYLINAIYFKGIWTKEFNEESTREGSFRLEDGSAKNVNMMHFEEEIGYYDHELFQGCELDYGNGNYSMLVLLPKPEVSLTELAAAFNTESWENWSGSFSNTLVNLKLPRFTFEYEKTLNDILSLMGMGIAFSPSADFTGINAAGGLFINRVKHKSFVEVNEEGTEAAAVTVVEVFTTSIEEDPATYMVVDHPFLFAIREKTTNHVVFMGKVAEPTEEE